MFGHIKQVSTVLLNFSESSVSMAKVSSHAECISLNNQLCMTRFILYLQSKFKWTSSLSIYG